MRFLPSPGRGGRSAFLAPRTLPAVLAPAAALLILADRLEGVDAGEVAGAVARVPVDAWAMALAATLASFAAVAGYDALFHRWLGTGVARDRALLSGASAVALSQTLGFGLATGTLVRWRFLPDLSMAEALRVTTCVSLSFMAALGLIAGAASGLGVLVVAVVLALAGLSFARPARLPFRLPPVRLMLRLGVLATLDVGFAALALYALLPADAAIAFPTLLSAFAIALGAGLLTGAPGGVGPFELCLVTLLPQVGEPALLTSILAFRLVYYALPACLGLCALARSLPPGRVDSRSYKRPTVIRAEAGGLIGEPGHRLVARNGSTLHVAEASQTLVALGDPADGGRLGREDLSTLRKEAGRQSLWPAAYRLSPRSAAVARSAGWRVLPVSEEAWLVPGAFTDKGPDLRQLRRKLSQSERAGVTVEEAGASLPLAAMARVSASWGERMGGERGFSMGRFSPDTLAAQRVFLAWRDERLVAFVTFHATRSEWVLNLMRSTGDMPDGTMHALVRAAIAAAAREHVGRLSLSAMPLETPSSCLRRLPHPGLRRFKLTFAPRRTKLYLAAPGPLLLALAGADILLRIRRPESAGSATFAALQKMHGGCADWSVVPSAVSAHIPLERNDQE